jgi:hypothetical protein
MIRYYGFLSNRHRSKLLPIVNRIFNNDSSPKIKMTCDFYIRKLLVSTQLIALFATQNLDLDFCVLATAPLILNFGTVS